MNKQLLMLTLGTSIALTGCDSLLYGNTMAPIFSSNNTPMQTQTPPPILNQPMTPIEQPMSGDAIAIERAQTNPYADAPLRPNMSGAVEQAGQNVNAAGQNVANDPRVKEATEVLAENNPNAPLRPGQVAQRPVEQVKQQATQRVNETVAKAENTVAETKTAVTKPVAAAAATAAATATAATEAVRPAPTTTKSATRALLQEAKGAVSAGEYDKAASALERAHRIEPGNAKILYDIAQIRYAQGNYRQASSFASKAATYSNSPTLSKKVWSLLSNARKKLGNNTGAAAAAQKAASFQ